MKSKYKTLSLVGVVNPSGDEIYVDSKIVSLYKQIAGRMIVYLVYYIRDVTCNTPVTILKTTYFVLN